MTLPAVAGITPGIVTTVWRGRAAPMPALVKGDHMTPLC